MKIQFLIGLLCHLLFLSSGIASDLKPIELTDENDTYLIGSCGQIYEDETNKLTISEICSDSIAPKFKEIGTDYPNFGISSSTYWIRFSVKSHKQFRAFLFNIGYLFHDKLEMYRVVNNIPEQVFFSDIEMGEISHNHHRRDRFVVPLELKENDVYEYYLSVRDKEGTSMFLELSSEETFLNRQANDSLRIGIVSGIFILSSFFTLIIYYRKKNLPYLLLFLLNIFFIMTLLTQNGNLQILIWPGNLKLNHNFFVFCGFTSIALNFLFTIFFLDLKNKQPIAHQIGIILSVLMFIGAISPLIGIDDYIFIFFYILAIGSILDMLINILSLIRTSKLNKTFFISKLIFSSVILSFALLKLGLIPYLGPVYDIIIQLALCFQISLLAFVITDYKYKVEIVQLEQEKNKEKQRNEELHQANKIKMEFLGMASHDLKGPLRNISTLASFIENKQIFKEDEIIGTSAMIRQSSERLANLVKDLLDNTALEMGRLELRLEKIDIIKSIKNILEQFELELKRKNQTIHLITEIDKKLYVEVDEIRFSQVIENLVSNAVKFSPMGKNIWVVVSKPENASVLLEIRDEGPGFTEEDKKYLFNYYKKLSAKPTGKESSSGLGLSIVKKIVQLHNGKIWLESEHGKGASFFVEL